MPTAISNSIALRAAMVNLREQFRAEGLFAVTRYRQAVYIVELLALLFGSFALLHQGGLAAACGLLLLALYYPRAAYAGHDVAHAQWFGRGSAATRRAAMILGFLQGFGAVWWAEKHDLHHDYPNGYRIAPDGAIVAVDGDIDTAPWLIWNPILHTPASLGEYAWLVRRQAFLLFPLLSLTRMNWSMQGFWQAVRRGDFVETAYILGHWAAGLTLAGSLTPAAAWTGWLWFLGAQMFGGLILGCVFVLNHTGMQVYDVATKDDFFERQACSTRNTPCGKFFDWLTGGLNHHIEHHMFPALPRHSLAAAAGRIRAAMVEHGFDYASLSNRAATTAVFIALHEAARI